MGGRKTTLDFFSQSQLVLVVFDNRLLFLPLCSFVLLLLLSSLLPQIQSLSAQLAIFVVEALKRQTLDYL